MGLSVMRLRPGYLLIDEAQESYGDEFFWNDFLKAAMGLSGGLKVVLAASHGSYRTSLMGHGTPLVIPDCSIMETTAKGIGHPGVWLTRDEYNDLACRIGFQNRVKFSQNLLDEIFHATRGHCGASSDSLSLAVQTPVGSLSWLYS